MVESQTESCDQSKVSDTERKIIASVLAVVGALGISGNSLVIAAVLLFRKLRSPTNVFVVNLGVADWITCFNITWLVIAMVNPECEWPLPDWICVWCSFNLISCVGCSAFTLAFIALNRLAMITAYSSLYQRLFTPCRMAFMVALAWGIPLTLAMVPLVSNFGELGYDPKYRTCTWDTTNPNSDLYSLTLAMAFTPIPGGIIVVSYTKIFLHIWRHSRRLHPSTSIPIGNNTSSQVSGLDLSETRPVVITVPTSLRNNLNKRQVEVTKNMFYIVCAFMVCLMPFGISLMLAGQNIERFVLYSGVALVCSSFVNPIIYSTKHPDFKGALTKIVKCKVRPI